MSAPTTRSAARPGHTRTEAGLGTALVRTARAEWRRLWSVRSTWWFVGATGVAVLGLGFLLTLDTANNPGIEVPPGGAWTSSQFAAIFALFGVVATAVVTTTADHTTGGIVPSLQWTPRRGVLLAARTLVVVLTLTAYALVLLTLVAVTVHVASPRFGLDAGDGARILGTIGFVLATNLLLAVGVGLLTRSTAGGLVTVIGLDLVLPLVLAIVPVDGFERLGDLMPGTAVLFLLLDGGASDLTPTTARLTLAAWAAAAMVLGGMRLARSDAGH
jgi:ABC-2 type transport system permease protein